MAAFRVENGLSHQRIATRSGPPAPIRLPVPTLNPGTELGRFYVGKTGPNPEIEVEFTVAARPSR
jgi:hypothetical protein